MPIWAWIAGAVTLVMAYALMFSMAAIAGRADASAQRAIVDHRRERRRSRV